MSSIESVYLLMLTTGLLGGFGHCSGMCGPVVAAYSLGLGERRLITHLLYNLGRITTYCILGGIAGMTGSFVSLAGSISNLQNIVIAVTGGAMIVMGLGIATRLRLTGRKGEVSVNRLNSLVLRGMKSISETRGIGVYYPMGLILGFIPCGLLYTVLIAAAGAGAASDSRIEGLLRGTAMLFLFGLGTLPALFLIGQLTVLAGEKLKSMFYRVSGGLMILTGIVFIFRAVR